MSRLFVRGRSTASATGPAATAATVTNAGSRRRLRTCGITSAPASAAPAAARTAIRTAGEGLRRRRTERDYRRESPVLLAAPAGAPGLRRGPLVARAVGNADMERVSAGLEPAGQVRCGAGGELGAVQPAL